MAFHCLLQLCHFLLMIETRGSRSGDDSYDCDALQTGPASLGPIRSRILGARTHQAKTSVVIASVREGTLLMLQTRRQPGFPSSSFTTTGAMPQYGRLRSVGNNAVGLNRRDRTAFATLGTSFSMPIETMCASVMDCPQPRRHVSIFEQQVWSGAADVISAGRTHAARMPSQE